MENWQVLSGYGRLCGLNDEQLETLSPLYRRIASDPAAAAFFLRCRTALLQDTLTPAELDTHYSGRELAQLHLLLVLSLYPAGEENFRRLGWPLEILREGAGDVAIWVKHHEENFGFPGLQWRIVGWSRGFYAGSLIQLGRLQCNTDSLFEGHFHVFRGPNGELQTGSDAPAGWTCALAPHDPVISIHIPASGPLKIPDCKASIRRMAEFFDKYLPDFGYKAVVCYSWFLDPQLKDILPPHSNILRFQEMGHLFEFAEASETIWRVFGEKGVREGVNAVPHVTDMQKRMAAFVNAGGEFKSGGMFILKDEIATRCME